MELRIRVLNVEENVILHSVIISSQGLDKMLVSIEIEDVKFELCALFSEESELYYYDISNEETKRFCELYRETEPNVVSLFLCVCDKQRQDILFELAKEKVGVTIH